MNASWRWARLAASRFASSENGIKLTMSLILLYFHLILYFYIFSVEGFLSCGMYLTNQYRGLPRVRFIVSLAHFLTPALARLPSHLCSKTPANASV
jgi:hypothetical protein